MSLQIFWFSDERDKMVEILKTESGANFKLQTFVQFVKLG